MNGNAYRNCTCADCQAAFAICSISQPCLKFIEIGSGNKCSGMVSDPVKKFANFGDGTTGCAPNSKLLSLLFSVC